MAHFEIPDVGVEMDEIESIIGRKWNTKGEVVHG